MKTRFLTGIYLFLCLSAAAREQPPNILFAIADDWGLHAGAYGTDWVKTPAFDRVAKEGLLFKNAYTPNAKCAPSRACVITGRYPWQLEEAGNHLAFFPAKFQSWPETLMKFGWHVGITGKGWGPGVANDISGKPRKITGVPYNKQRLKPATSGITNTDYAANFTDFLEDTPKDTPWCFWYGALEPHRKYQFGSGLKKGGKNISEIDQVPAYWPDTETVRTDILDYAFEVEHADHHLAQMLAELEKRDLLENTIVIVTSDHGMPFPRVKGHTYPDANHIPLAIRWPKGIKVANRVIEDFVDFTDIAPTLLEIANIKQSESGMAEISGKSWLPIFQSEKSGQIIPERDHAIIGKERTDIGRPNDGGYPTRGIIYDGFVYLKNYEPSRWPAGNPETGYLDTDGSPSKSLILEMGREDRSDRFWKMNFGKRPSEELYDLKADPDCMNNLAEAPAHEAKRTSLLNKMSEQLKQHGDPRMFGNGKIFDEYPATSNHRFYEKYMSGERPKTGWVNPTDYESGPLD